MAVKPLISTIVVSWRDAASLRQLLEVWPADPRFELIVVDNSEADYAPPASSFFWPKHVRRLGGQGNLGFGGGCNLGAEVAQAPWLLFLNPDALPLAGALEALAGAPAADPSAAGFVPALEFEDGRPQCAWQLQPLPSQLALFSQIFFFGGARGPLAEPPALTAIGQPAAAALMLDAALFREIGGFDPTFFPAWFEDVDLARRLAGRSARLLYWPTSRFRHQQGSSVSSLGYGAFLWIYDRHLCHYLRKHHGWLSATAARLLLPISLLLRIAALPWRKPRRARSRLAAARDLGAVLAGALTNFRYPRAWYERFRRSPSSIEPGLPGL